MSARGARLALLAIALALPLHAAACARYKGDVERLCEAEQTAPKTEPPRTVAPPSTPRLHQLDRAAQAVASTMRTPEGKRFAQRFMSVDADPGKLLDAEAKRVGVVPCALADAYLVEREIVRYRFDLQQLCGFSARDLAGHKWLTDRARALVEALDRLDPKTRAQRLDAAAQAEGFVGCAQARSR